MPPPLPAAPPGTPANQFLQQYQIDDCAAPTKEWCENYVALVPNGTGDAGVAQGELVVLFPGLNMAPDQLEHLAYIAAYAGHRTLVVPWDTSNVPVIACSENDTSAGYTVTYAGGQCVDACSSTYRNEMLTGVDNASTEPETAILLFDSSGDAIPNPIFQETLPVGHQAQYFSSIRQRIARGLNQLAEADLDDGTNDWRWNDYCTPDDEWGTRIEWDSVIVGGFSAGASMAQYIAHQRETAGVFSADGLGDYCEADFDGVSGEPAPWVDGSPATPISRWRLAIHTASSFMNAAYVPKTNGFPDGYHELGILAQAVATSTWRTPAIRASSTGTTSR